MLLVLLLLLQTCLCSFSNANYLGMKPTQCSSPDSSSTTSATLQGAKIFFWGPDTFQVSFSRALFLLIQSLYHLYVCVCVCVRAYPFNITTDIDALQHAYLAMHSCVPHVWTTASHEHVRLLQSLYLWVSECCSGSTCPVRMRRSTTRGMLVVMSRTSGDALRLNTKFNRWTPATAVVQQVSDDCQCNVRHVFLSFGR